MATLALFVGVGHWNNWYDSTFFVKTKTLRTLPYLMMEIINQFQSTASDTVAAAHELRYNEPVGSAGSHGNICGSDYLHLSISSEIFRDRNDGRGGKRISAPPKRQKEREK